jgi:hypothetical protein
VQDKTKNGSIVQDHDILTKKQLGRLEHHLQMSKIKLSVAKNENVTFKKKVMDTPIKPSFSMSQLYIKPTYYTVFNENVTFKKKVMDLLKPIKPYVIPFLCHMSQLYIKPTYYTVFNTIYLFIPLYTSILV